MATGFTDFIKNVKGLFAPWDGLTAANAAVRNVDDEVNKLFEVTVSAEKVAADAMASTTTASVYFHKVDRECSVVSATYVPRGTATFNASTYGTIILNKADGAGGSDTNVATVDTSAVSMANGVTRALTLVTTAGVVDLTAGQVLAFQITKASTGVALPAGMLQVRLRVK